jgi:hypothetical protein
VPVAGAKLGYGRSESFRAADRGEIPTKRFGKFRLVERALWDRKVRLLLGGKPRRSQPRKPEAHHVTETA